MEVQDITPTWVFISLPFCRGQPTSTTSLRKPTVPSVSYAATSDTVPQPANATLTSLLSDPCWSMEQSSGTRTRNRRSTSWSVHSEWQYASLPETIDLEPLVLLTGLLRKHELPTLQERRECLRLTYFYKVVEGLVPPEQFLVPQPPEQFLVPQQRRRIRRPIRGEDFVVKNPVDNNTRNNDRCYIVPNCSTEQYRQSFFPRTMVGWNKLDNTVHSGSTEAFKQAVAKAQHHYRFIFCCAPPSVASMPDSWM